MAVAQVQALLAPDAEVKHNVYLCDTHGRRRQFDVVVRITAAGYPILGVIECRDRTRPLDIPAVDGFVTKARSVNANLAVLVSRMGFTKTALRAAWDNGISTYSLMTQDLHRMDPAVGMDCCVRLFGWAKARLRFRFAGAGPDATDADLRDACLEGARVLNWFYREFSTTYAHGRAEGWHELSVTFGRPVEVTVGGCAYPIWQVSCAEWRVVRTKIKRAGVSGDALHDWRSGRMIFPKGGRIIVAAPHQPDFSDWPNYPGEMPVSSGPFRLCMDLFSAVPERCDGDTPELARYGVVSYKPPEVPVVAQGDTSGEVGCGAAGGN